MPSHLKALVALLFVATLVFVLTQRSAQLAGMQPEDFRRRRNVWYLVTLIAFLAHNFWLYILLTGLVVTRFSRQESNPLALYGLIFLAVPSFEQQIPGVGPIDHIFSIGYVRLLNLTVLLPYAIRLWEERKSTGSSVLRGVDVAIVSWALWVVLVHTFSDSITGAVRTAFYTFVDTLIPYFVASRSLNDLRRIRETLASFALCGLLLAAIAFFETTRHWLLYESLRTPLGIPRESSIYLTRGVGGILRARASAQHAIALGYVLTMGIIFAVYTWISANAAWRKRAVVAVFIAGLVCSMSRGPWVGAAAGLLTLAVLGPFGGRRLMSIVAGGSVLVGVLLLTPFGQKIIDYLPFVGTVETGNIDYRATLFSVSMEVMKQNFWLGDLHYLKNPMMEQMRQGQGIIDMVNTYLQVALPYGAIGLIMFAAVLVKSLLGANRLRKAARQNEQAERIGRTLTAAMIAILVIIATTSSISVIPTIYWIVAGLCVGYGRTVDVALQAETKRARVGRRAKQNLDPAR